MSIKIQIRGPSPRCFFARKEMFVYLSGSHRNWTTLRVDILHWHMCILWYMYVYTRICTNICIYTYMYVNEFICLCTNVFLYIYMYVHKYVYINIVTMQRWGTLLEKGFWSGTSVGWLCFVSKRGIDACRDPKLILSSVCGTRRERLCVVVRGCRLDRQTAHRQPVAWFDRWSHLVAKAGSTCIYIFIV